MAAAVKFKRDSYLRARLFTADSFKHSGKINLNQLTALIERLPAGELILDPMAGTGSILLAADYQHPVIAGDLERHWCEVAEANRKSIAGRRLFAASTPALTGQWDAMNLPFAAGSIPAIVTSPPYWDMLSDWHISSKGLQDSHEIYGPAYGVAANNIGNIHIYEQYLRAMRQVYSEAHRCLSREGVLGLVVKNRVHKKRVIPIVRDTIALVTAQGFNLIERIDRLCNPSLHRRVNQSCHPDAPTVDTEAALIFQKQKPDRVLKHLSIIQAPKPDSAPSRQLYQKQINYARYTKSQIALLQRDGISLDLPQLPLPPDHSGFRRRKEFSFDAAADLVTKFGFAAGDDIALHCSMAYGKYLAQRLETFGLNVTNPTEGLNMGQKLAWYTEQTRWVD